MSDSSKPNRGEDLAKLRLSQDFAGLVSSKKRLTHIPTRRPDRQWFIRTHHSEEMWFSAAVLELKETNETYLVAPEAYDELATEIIPKYLVPTVNRQGHFFFWPIRQPGEDGQIDEWNRTSLLAADLARTKWVRVASNRSIGAYDTYEAMASLVEPNWEDLSLEQWLELAYGNRVIGDGSHPVIRKLRGEE